MSIEQIQLYLIEGSVLVLAIAVWILERRRQRMAKGINNLLETIGKKSAHGVAEMFFGSMGTLAPIRVKRTRKPRTNKTKQTGQK